MTSSVSVAFLLLSLGVTNYVESVCQFETTLNARTDLSRQLTWAEGASVLTTCFEGYATDELLKSFMRTCTNGQWIPAHQCYPIICRGLPQVESADVLFLSDVSITNDEYPVNSVALVICNPGFSTELGRLRFISGCSDRAVWNDTAPCSVSIRPEMSQYARFGIQLTETSIPFDPALSNPNSPAAQALSDSLGRAEFGGSYVGAENFMFSNSPNGLLIDFDTLFLPSVNFKPEELSMRITSALNNGNYQGTDSNDGTTYTFLRNQLDVSRERVSQFSREARIGLAIAGAVVALMAFIAIILWCCCGNNNKIINALPQRRINLSRIVPQNPSLAVPSPYAEIGDVQGWGLPRLRDI